MTTFNSEVEALQAMITRMERCGGNVGIVVTASCPFTDLPGFDSIGPRDGVDVRTQGEVRHAGFGCFIAEAPNGLRLSFDGGPYMNDVRKPNGNYAWSWTDLRAQSPETLASTGYNWAQVLQDLRIALRDIGGPVCEVCDNGIDAAHEGATLCVRCAEEGLENLETDYHEGHYTFTEWQALAAQTVAQGRLNPSEYLRDAPGDPCDGCGWAGQCDEGDPADCRRLNSQRETDHYPNYDR